VWTGPARSIGVDVDGPVASGLLHLVDTSGASASLGERLSAAWRGMVEGPPPATGMTQAPAIVTRAGWGADESLRRDPPSYGRVLVAFVDDTVGSNSYAPQDSPAIVRG